MNQFPGSRVTLNLQDSRTLIAGDGFVKSPSPVAKTKVTYNV